MFRIRSVPFRFSECCSLVLGGRRVPKGPHLLPSFYLRWHNLTIRNAFCRRIDRVRRDQLFKRFDKHVQEVCYFCVFGVYFVKKYFSRGHETNVRDVWVMSIPVAELPFKFYFYRFLNVFMLLSNHFNFRSINVMFKLKALARIFVIRCIVPIVLYCKIPSLIFFK